MKTNEIFEIIKSTIATTRENGASQVSLDNLQAFVKEVEKTASLTPADVSAGEAAMEAYKADLSAWVSSRQQEHETDLEMLRSVIATGQSALKSSLLINGGASVAILGFIGSVWSDQKTTVMLPSLSISLLFFVWGVLLAAVAAGATYVTQAGYGREFGPKSQAIGRFAHVLSVLGVVGAYTLFGLGAWRAYLAFSG
jgi:hypothetical protein